MIRIIVTIGLLVAAVLYLYWLGAFDLPISAIAPIAKLPSLLKPPQLKS